MSNQQTTQAQANLNPKYIAIAVRHAAYGPNMMLTRDEAQHEMTIQNIIALSRVVTASDLARLQSQMKEVQQNKTAADDESTNHG